MTSKKFILMLTFLHLSLAAGPLDTLRSIYKYYQVYPAFPNVQSPPDREIQAEYDFIIVGAGSGGSVVANRLTENPKWRVLLLEAGREEMFLTDWPLMAPAMHMTGYNWGYKTEPARKNQSADGGYCLSMINGRCNWPRGKAVGGTSVINFMIHSRGSKADFDRWQAEGNAGWSYDDVLPYFIKSEKFMARPQPGVNTSIHGHNGYLDVTMCSWASKLRNKFLAAGEEMGYRVKDCNEADPTGFCPTQANLRFGRRVSAAKAYIRPIRRRRNFYLSKNSHVTRIVIDPVTKVTVGVEFIKQGQKYLVRALKEVILSAGSLNSPQILMLSGVGPKEHLDEHKIQVIQDLPVGYNLQDHVSMSALTFLVNESVTIVDYRVANLKNTMDFFSQGSGPFTVPAGAEALAFIDTTTDLRREGARPKDPDVELVFGIGSMAGDVLGTLRSIFALGDDWYRRVFNGFFGRDAFSIVPVLLHPRSRGRVSLRSANPLDSPRLEANYFNDDNDLTTLVRGIKKAIEVASSRPFKRYNATLLPIKFPGCEKLYLNSDKYWRCVCRQISTTLGHFIGTCKMGPRHSGGVIDERLRVYGVERLRVVDASVMPTLIAGHTNAPTYMIAEKASDMIKSDYAFELNVI